MRRLIDEIAAACEARRTCNTLASIVRGLGYVVMLAALTRFVALVASLHGRH